MSGAPALLRNAHQRADGLRSRYRAANFWSDRPLDVVRATAERHPLRPALVIRGSEVSYTELDERIDRASQALLDAGVGGATPVVVAVGNDIGSVVAVHAVIRVDAVVLLVPRSAGAVQIADIIARTGAAHGVAAGWAGIDDPVLRTSCRWIDTTGLQVSSARG
ncbi:MAG TPA: AMP-binding protein, partial [Mycobacterium sp.]|nr:AMP-binding protein [Mycobacterium sp.]